MNQFTPAQSKAIETWTEKRDSLLREIGVYSDEYNSLIKKTKEEGENLAELHKQIEFAKGRLTQMSDIEERYKNSVSNEILELEVRKSRLEGEIKTLETKIGDANSRLELEMIATKNLSDTHTIMKDQAVIVNRVVGEMIQTAETHFSDVGRIVTEIKNVASEIIEKGNENVKQTNIVLEKLPRYIFELQRPIPVRRIYAPERGTKIEPENKK